MPFNTLLVPLDGSTTAEQVLPHVTELARQLHSTVHLVTVISPTEKGANVAMMGPYAGQIAHADAAAEGPESPVPSERADEYLSNVAMRLHAENVKASYEVRTGQPVDELLTASHRQDVSLIAIASHGRTGFRRAVLGSVADELLRRSGKPVMVVKTRAD